MPSEDFLVETKTRYLDLLIKSKLQMSILGLYIGVYHSFIVKDMFSNDSSQRLYMQISTAILSV